jgi:hypothetical protein
VDGARIPVNNSGSAPCRIASRSSIESPPVSIPATIEVIFAPGFAPALPAVSGNRMRWSAVSCKPARSASRISGIRPACDTRSGSSNVTDTAPAV